MRRARVQELRGEVSPRRPERIEARGAGRQGVNPSVTFHDVEQRSEAWGKLRLGRVTASRSSDMLAKNRDGKWAAGRRNLLVQLLLERLTGRSHERQFQSGPMQDGVTREQDAIAA